VAVGRRETAGAVLVNFQLAAEDRHGVMYLLIVRVQRPLAILHNVDLNELAAAIRHTKQVAVLGEKIVCGRGNRGLHRGLSQRDRPAVRTGHERRQPGPARLLHHKTVRRLLGENGRPV